MSFSPIVVAFPRAVFPVGIARWRQYGEDRVTFVAKLTFALDAGSLAPDQIALDGRDDDGGFAPGDFVPRKAGVDLLIAGSARGASGAQRHPASVAVASSRPRRSPEGPSFRRELVVASDGLAPVVVLGTANVLEADGVTAAGSLGRIELAGELPRRGETHPVDFGFHAYQAADPRQQLTSIAPGAVIALGGALGGALGSGAAREVRVPRAPWLFLDRGFGAGALAPVVCDTVEIDLDRQTLVAVWRADLALDERDIVGIDRVVAYWPETDQELDVEDLRALVPRATLALAEELGRTADPGDADLLRVARLDAMEVAAAPSLDLDTYALISASLAEGRPPREQVLARHGLTEDAWAIEERAYGERIAQNASRGDVEDAAAFGAAFVAAQDGLAEPSESDWTVEQHAVLTAELEVARDVPTTLAKHGLALGAYIRIDRRIAKLVASDPAANARFESALEKARAENPDGDDDDDDEEDA